MTAELSPELGIRDQAEAIVVTLPTDAKIEWDNAHFSPAELAVSGLAKRSIALIAQAQMIAIYDGFGTWQEKCEWLSLYQQAIGPVEPI